MAFYGRKLCVSLPDTLLEETDSLLMKTVKLGYIARSCAIFGVDQIEIYKEKSGKGESKFIAKLLSYLETPQYLRKRLFKLDKDLKYAGILHPLRIPSHKRKVSFGDIMINEVREGITKKENFAYIGLDRDIKLKGSFPAGKRVTVRIVSKEPFVGEIIQKEQVPEYWGYDIKVCSQEDVFKDEKYKLKLSTSRYGNSIKSIGDKLKEGIFSSDSIKIVFGSPSKGLFDIFGPELTKFSSFVVNLYLEQNVETVRTEEALMTALSMINNMLALC